MNREFKFRAWDSLKKVMLYEYMWIEQRDGYIATNVQSPITARITDAMQYTGLKDKNGKEIYEGDILKGKTGKLITVEWLPYTAQYNITTEASDWSKIEVIGNIYENPRITKGR